MDLNKTIKMTPNAANCQRSYASIRFLTYDTSRYVNVVVEDHESDPPVIETLFNGTFAPEDAKAMRDALIEAYPITSQVSLLARSMEYEKALARAEERLNEANTAASARINSLATQLDDARNAKVEAERRLAKYTGSHGDHVTINVVDYTRLLQAEKDLRVVRDSQNAIRGALSRVGDVDQGALSGKCPPRRPGWATRTMTGQQEY